MFYVAATTAGTISGASSAVVAATKVQAGQMIVAEADPTNWTAGTIEIVWRPGTSGAWRRTGQVLGYGVQEFLDARIEAEGYVGVRSKSDFTTGSSVAVSVRASDRVTGQ